MIALRFHYALLALVVAELARIRRADRKRARGICATPRCTNRTRPGRRDCYTCNTRAKRAANPARYAYSNLKAHAIERGIEFTISFDEFLEFAQRSEYLERKGKAAGSLSVDRIDNLRGYVPGNIQALTLSENSRKLAKFDAIRFHRGRQWAELEAVA